MRRWGAERYEIRNMTKEGEYTTKGNRKSIEERGRSEGEECGGFERVGGLVQLALLHKGVSQRVFRAFTVSDVGP